MTKEQIKTLWNDFKEPYREIAESRVSFNSYEPESMGDETVNVNKGISSEEADKVDQELEKIAKEEYGQFIWDNRDTLAPFFMSDYDQLLDDDMPNAVAQWADSEETSYEEFTQWMEA